MTRPQSPLARAGLFPAATDLAAACMGNDSRGQMPQWRKPPLPSPRQHHAMAQDAARRRVPA